jgi:hypothetical protein
MKQQYWRFRAGIVIENQKSLLIIDTNSAEIFQVNTSAKHLIPLLASGSNLKDLASSLHHTFSINLGVAKQDALALIHQLARWNLIDAYDG